MLAWRVRRQHLDQRVAREALIDVVSRLCGLHAQVLSSAELTLWARVDDLAPDDVRRALWDDRSLVKTWAMRGTLHLLPAAEFPRWQAALSTYHHYLKPAWLRAFGLTREELDHLVAGVAEALDGRMLTREELAGAVAQVTGNAELAGRLRESWGAMLKPASFQGRLCFAPNRGQNVRFTRPDQWLPGWAPANPDAALTEVVRRYLGAYGPATREDFARWWGVSPAHAGRLILSLGDEVTQVDVEDTPAWMRNADVAEAAQAGPDGSVRLLPAFDQYVIAAPRHVSGVLAVAIRDRVYRSQGWISPVLLVDGRMDGVWRHERTGDRLAVRIEPFDTIPAPVRQAAEDEAGRLAGFMGCELDLSWSA